MNEENNDNKFMQLAIDKAREGINEGQTPFGACIVKDNEVISCEHNVVWGSTDITAHAEIHAIRKACEKLNRIDLEGCTIYSTCEPCPMCFSAIHWAKISKIVFGARIADAEAAGFHELAISNETMKEQGKSKVELIPEVLQEEAKRLFDEWKAKHGEKVY